MDLDQERLDEITKYISAYKYPEYRMGDLRKASAQGLLMAAPSRESFLDIGCGRGEMLDYAKEKGRGFRQIPRGNQRAARICIQGVERT